MELHPLKDQKLCVFFPVKYKLHDLLHSVASCTLLPAVLG